MGDMIERLFKQMQVAVKKPKSRIVHPVAGQRGPVGTQQSKDDY
jgi:hypothetical protein